MLMSLITAVVSGEASDAVARARKALVVYAAAGLLALTGAGFLVGAGFVALAGRIGAIPAALWLGGGAILLALLIVLIHRLMARIEARRVARQRRTEIKAVAGATALALLPSLLSGKGRGLALLAPAVAALGYAVWRENSTPKGGGGKPDGT